jgi:GNAT superfamily N-acetyltransferase
MHITYLADHMHVAPVLAAWHYGEWSVLLPGWSYDDGLAELRTHIGRRQVPTTYVVLDGVEPVGSASFVVNDPDIWLEYSPWLASVFVAPAWRGKGVGSLLVARAVEDARLLGLDEIYLYTTQQQAFYSRTGWVERERAIYNGHCVTRMSLQLGDRAV